MPLWGVVVLGQLIVAASLLGWWSSAAQRKRSARTDWVAGLRRRVPSRGRVRVDPQYVRDEFACIAKTMPELARPNPRLFALYLVPGEE